MCVPSFPASTVVRSVVLLFAISASNTINAKNVKLLNEGSLFKEGGPVVVLNSENFDRYMYGNDHAMLVDFYANWCGHCQRFASSYTRFASDAENWKQVVQIGAVDCGNVRNHDLCRREQVLYFPVLKMYAPHSKRGDRAYDVPVREHIWQLVRDSAVHNLVGLAMQTSPPNWPDFRPLNATIRNELTSKLPLEKPTLVIVENSDSSVGNQVILDMSAYSDKVDIRRMFPSYNRNLMSELLPNSNIALPSLLKINKNDIGEVEVDLLESSNDADESGTRHTFVKRIGADFLNDSWHDVQEIPATQSTFTNGDMVIMDSEAVQSELMAVHYDDLYNTLRYALYHEVLLHKEYNASQVEALRKFFFALNAYFPFDNENPRRFVKRMAQWFHENRNATDAKDLHAIMRAGSEGYLPGTRPWRACAGSDPRFRGYPCGLWLLFHVLTVSEYSKNDKASSLSDYNSVLFAMQDYVRHFFGCRDCADHFLAMSANIDGMLLHPESSVLWLWDAHNQVNGRLRGDATEDPKHPKVQFPTVDQCPDCRPVQDEWHAPAVLKFLVNHYHKANIIRNSSTTAHPSAINFIVVIFHILAASSFFA
ncbi:Sulfhydryl oxidase 1 [Halotydeus destructor]|nr:Sulfhydryl oxidase 1 [Halotydeus destructor]